jgi:L-ascorbate metabolism protein UlaG (beta-lactamase superfamily)
MLKARETIYGGRSYEEDTIDTDGGPLVITCLGHATLMLRWGGLVVHVDPVSAQAGYAAMPRADVILVTHSHGDHFEPAVIDLLRKPDTEVVMSGLCHGQTAGKVVRNGDRLVARGLAIEVVPAYNLRHTRPDGRPFHPRGEGNGYLVTFGNRLVYIAGDTEDTPEVRALSGVDVAFLPMNLPYTMTPEMVAGAARAFGPAILYPYHFGSTDTGLLQRLLADCPGVEVRLRRLA